MPGEPLAWPSRRPIGKSTPAGIVRITSLQNNSSSSVENTSTAHRERLCFRKGCGNRYWPRRPNQRFCKQHLCQNELRRWQAAKRQRRHRQVTENRHRHAERERKRRLENALRPPEAKNECASVSPHQPTELHENQLGAWSHRRIIPKNFCDRPGCYEPTRKSHRNQAKYCGNACRNAVHRVQDRERKQRAAVVCSRKPFVKACLPRCPLRAWRGDADRLGGRRFYQDWGYRS